MCLQKVSIAHRLGHSSSSPAAEAAGDRAPMCDPFGGKVCPVEFFSAYQGVRPLYLCIPSQKLLNSRRQEFFMLILSAPCFPFFFARCGSIYLVFLVVVSFLSTDARKLGMFPKERLQPPKQMILGQVYDSNQVLKDLIIFKIFL